MARQQAAFRVDPVVAPGRQRIATPIEVPKAAPVAAPAIAVSPERRQRTTSRAARVGTRVAHLCTDLVVVTLCELFAVKLVHRSATPDLGSTLGANLAVGIALPLVVAAALSLNGLYRRWPRQLMMNTFSELRDIIYALAVAGCALVGVNHLFGAIQERESFEPITVVVTLMIAVLAVPSGRALLRAAMRAAAVEHFRVLIIGSGMMTTRLTRYLSWDHRITVVGCVDDEPMPGTPVLGTIDDLPTICADHAVDQVMVTFSRTHPAQTIERLQALNPKIAISIVPRFFDLMSWRSSVNEIAGLAVIDVAPNGLSLGARAAKRAFDVVVGTGTLIALSPLLLAATIAVKLTSPGPVFFRQERVGKNGKTFVVLKLRTMLVDAEQQQADPELQRANRMDGPLFKLSKDPRVTRIGGFLRRSSLDEVPQLFNVLRGDMSLVGPRPFIPSESEKIEGCAVRRFDVRPGMTGLWQISGRSHLSYDELKRLDYLYVASWSLWWDVKIMWHTPARVLRQHGAF